MYGVGQEAELELAKMLGHRGYTVVPINLFTNNTGKSCNAPMLVIGEGRSVSPDLLVMKNGKSTWIEVKGKSVPAYFYKWKCWVHGIDRPNAEAYKKAQDASNYPVFLCVLEEKSPLTPDLDLEWHENTPNGRADQDIAGPRQWLWITLDDAMAQGAYLPGNPAMMKDNNPRGYGLYWPRRGMRPFGQAA